MLDNQRHIHTPSASLPIAGVLPELVLERRNLHNVVARYAAEARAVGKPFARLCYGPFHRMLLVADPLIADEIMRSQHFANRTSFPIIDAIYAQFVGSSAITTNMGGITFVNAEPWRRNRAAALRCLSRPSFIEQTRRVTTACTDRLIASWRARKLINTRAPIDLGREMSRLAIDVMGQLCWKTDLGAIEGDHNRFFEPVRTMLDAIQRYIYVPLPASVLSILPTPTMRRLRVAVRKLRSMGDALMATRMDAAGRLREGDTQDDVLAFLLRELVTDSAAPHKDDLDNVQATLMDLLGAGHDTTANALAFCLGLLAQPAHAQWQERAAQEAQRLDELESEGRGSVLAAAYRETLRLYPLGAMFSRVASVDTTLTIAGEAVFIAAGTQTLVSPYAMGRDALEWKDVSRFQPDRHLISTDSAAGSCPQLLKRRIPAYAPYGGGKRGCVGAQFAEVEAHAALSRILRGFRLHLLQGDAEIEADLLFTMRPRKPLYVHVEERSKDYPSK